MGKKAMVFWVVGTIISLYTTFVVQNLWNWFMTEAFHLSEIPFWVMYGVILLFGALTYRSRFEDEHHFEILGAMIGQCVPVDKQESLKEELKTLQEQIWWKVGSEAFGKVVGTTFTLCLGWLVHTFLA